MSFSATQCRRTLVRCIVPLLGLACSVCAAQTPIALKYAGVNLSGAEFNPKKMPGTLNKDYRYPEFSDYSYFSHKGMNIVRLPFLWERLQLRLNDPLESNQLAWIRRAVESAKRNHQRIILDVHNYATYRNARIGSSQVPASAFANFWSQLAAAFKNDPNVIFGLMNEPNQIRADQWVQYAQAAIQAIRQSGANNLILVPGTAYTGGHSWDAPQYGGPSNATAMQNIQDPAHNMAIEIHQYLDNDYSGKAGNCISDTVGSQQLADVTNWLRQHQMVGFLAEFAGGNNQTCEHAVKDMLSFIQQNSDVWVGWTWWAAGEWWKSDYPFNVQPDPHGGDKPQMAWLTEAAQKVTASGESPASQMQSAGYQRIPQNGMRQQNMQQMRSNSQYGAGGGFNNPPSHYLQNSDGDASAHDMSQGGGSMPQTYYNRSEQNVRHYSRSSNDGGQMRNTMDVNSMGEGQ